MRVSRFLAGNDGSETEAEMEQSESRAKKEVFGSISGECLASFYLIELKLFALKDVALARLQVKRSI